jgi:hypothetical protein
MWGISSRNEHHLIQFQFSLNLLRNAQMAGVNGIKGSTEYSDMHKGVPPFRVFLKPET